MNKIHLNYFIKSATANNCSKQKTINPPNNIYTPISVF